MVKNSNFIALASFLALTSVANAAEVATNIAQMKAMDKITGRVSLIEAPVNGEVKFGSFSIVVRSCKTRPAEEIPENFAFVDVVDTALDKTQHNIFKGWMISSSPALNAVEHPIYDVWLLKCINGNSKQKLLTADQLKERDAMPRAEISLTERLKPIKEDAPVVKEEVVEEPAKQPEELQEEIVIDEVVDTSSINDVPQNIPASEDAPASLINFDEPANIQAEPAPTVEVEEEVQFLNLDEAPALVDDNLSNGEDANGQGN